ncbi:MAG: hypothetical protein ABSE51_22045 [Terracidiphilus sp.]
MPEQLCNRAQIDPGHNKSTGKRMAVAMPRIIKHLRVIERGQGPSAQSSEEIARARWDGREDGFRTESLLPEHWD